MCNFTYDVNTWLTWKHVVVLNSCIDRTGSVITTGIEDARFYLCKNIFGI
jgi:hypothetical protein